MNTAVVKTWVERARGFGYNYRTTLVTRYGSKPIGQEAHCVIDDFGNLVSVGGWRV
jgi:hypothetical protein